MRLMLDLGERADCCLDDATALLDALVRHDPGLELGIHLFASPRVDAHVRQQLVDRLGEGSVRVSPYPVSPRADASHADFAGVTGQLPRWLCRRVGQYVGDVWGAQGILRLMPADDSSAPPLADEYASVPCLTLPPDEALTLPGSLTRWLGNLAPEPAAQPSSPMPGSESGRPTLAFVSPLPPLQTGIADYSAELLDALAPYYVITLIADQNSVEPTELHQRFAIHDAEWFMGHGDTFDRVLYHWGNSPFHAYMEALIEHYPGSVVLHDFYLGNLVWHMARDEADFAQRLYRAHGYAALASLPADRTPQSIEQTLARYPLNHDVVKRAAGVLVHSRYALELAARWYPPQVLADWQHVPFLRQQPASLPDARAAARQALGIPPNAFVVCTFGLVTPNKCVQLLFDALAQSTLVENPEVNVVAVGGYGHKDYQQQLEQWLADYTGKARLCVTGYAEPERYRQYLQAADLGVQLRVGSRGETSAAVFDCLAAGLGLIANAHGSVRELKPDTACLLPDAFTQPELTQALETLYHDAGERRRLAQSAQHHVASSHNADVVGHAYARAIEHQYRHGRLSRYYRLLENLGDRARRLGQTLAPASVDALAECLDVTTPPPEPARLLLDVSNIANHDLRTGIERVTRNLCEVLLHAPPEGYRVEPVRSLHGRLHHARQYAAERLGCPHRLGGEEPLTARQDDIYVSLEWSPPVVAENYAEFETLKARGVKLYFIIFDALPLQFPHYFPGYVEGTYRDWLAQVLSLADGLCCISAAVADDVREQAARLPDLKRPATLPPLGHFHLGADFTARAATHGLRAADEDMLTALSANAPILLMVGTLEPRKGHTLVLNAMEQLWQAGHPARLVIVGKRGWHMETLSERLEEHPEAGQRLFWAQGASDDMLAELYQHSTALIAASEGEGFGLPLIEAAQRGIPIIVRDIPVFREVAGSYASYFSATDAQGLARELEQWLDARAAGQTPSVSGMPWLDWQQSAAQLLRLVLPGGLA